MAEEEGVHQQPANEDEAAEEVGPAAGEQPAKGDPGPSDPGPSGPDIPPDVIFHG